MRAKQKGAPESFVQDGGRRRCRHTHLHGGGVTPCRHLAQLSLSLSHAR